MMILWSMNRIFSILPLIRTSSPKRFLSRTDPSSGCGWYWGHPYEAYMKNQQLFVCPSSKQIRGPYAYGINTYVEGSRYKAWSFEKPAETIVAHDSWETRMDDNGDMLCPASGQSRNLTQHTAESARLEYWRHNSSCNVLWLDGHVKTLTRSASYPREWYTGS